MKNSPTICQYYVAWALTPVRQQYPQWLIYHYMDDVLVAGSTLPDDVITILQNALARAHLVIAVEKFQRFPAYKYLGLTITDTIVRPQKLHLITKIDTLHDVQKLVGDLQWLRPYCGITNEDLQPLVELLKGGGGAESKRVITSKHQQAIQRIEQKISAIYSGRRKEGLAYQYAILNSETTLTAVIMQWDEKAQDPLIILEWLFPPSYFHKTIVTRLEGISWLIRKGRQRIHELAAGDFELIYVPYTEEQIVFLLQESLHLALALQGFAGQLFPISFTCINTGVAFHGKNGTVM